MESVTTLSNWKTFSSGLQVVKLCENIDYTHIFYNNYYNFTIINPRPEGYGSRFVVHSFVRSFILSTALQRAALTSSRQLRYEQAKHVDGLQSDSWILLKCFRSRVMAGSP